MKKFSKDEALLLCNLTSQGVPMAKAKAKVLAARGSTEAEAGAEAPKETKESAKDKRFRLSKEIEAAGGDVPAAGASVAKYEEALTAANAANEDSEDEDLI